MTNQQPSTGRSDANEPLASDRPGDLPTPKFHLGDVAYYAVTTKEVEQLPCPDCLGSRTWTLTSPAGETHTAPCPRCTGFGHSGFTDALPSLQVRRRKPSFSPFTIRYVEVSSASRYHQQDRVRYMSSDTGSGTVKCESELFATPEEALAVAQALATADNTALDARPEAVRSRAFSAFPVGGAHARLSRDAVFESWTAFRRLADAVTDLLPESSNQDNELEGQLREAVDRYARGAGTYLPPERHVIDALLVARTPEEVATAGAALKRALGLPDEPEPPPCTCEHAVKHLFSPDCPRHGSRDDTKLI